MAHPVTQAVGMRFVYFGYGYVDVEAVVQFFLHVARLEDDAYGKQVIDFLERHMLGLHLVGGAAARRRDPAPDGPRGPGGSGGEAGQAGGQGIAEGGEGALRNPGAGPGGHRPGAVFPRHGPVSAPDLDRKSTRLNSSH